MSEDILRYCCLRQEFLQLSKLTSKKVLKVLSTQCYKPLNSITFLNETEKSKELHRRKKQFLIWFWKNASSFRNTECPETATSINDGACSASTESVYAMYTILWILLLVMIIWTNLLIIASILKVSYLRQAVSNLFILSLSFSDLFVGISVIPIKIGFYSSNMTFCYGINICRLYLMADSAFSVISILNLVIIAIDRHLALNHPYRYPSLMTRRKAKIVIALIWMYGFCYSCLMNIKFDDISQDAIIIDHGSCQTNKNTYLVFLTYTLHFVFPIICMGVVYYRILRITKHHARSISESVIFDNNNLDVVFNTTKNKDDNNNNNIVSGIFAYHKKSNSKSEKYTIENKDFDKAIEAYQQSARALRRNSSKSMEEYRRIVKKATQTVAAVYGTYVICWFPVVVFSYVYVLCEPCIKDINPTVYIIFIQFFPLMNSMMNAFLYAIINKQFRKGFKQVLSCRKFK